MLTPVIRLRPSASQRRLLQVSTKPGTSTWTHCLSLPLSCPSLLICKDAAPEAATKASKLGCDNSKRLVRSFQKAPSSWLLLGKRHVSMGILAVLAFMEPREFRSSKLAYSQVTLLCWARSLLVTGNNPDRWFDHIHLSSDHTKPRDFEASKITSPFAALHQGLKHEAGLLMTTATI